MTALFLSILCTLTPFVNAIPHPAVQTPQAVAVYLKPYSAVPTGHFNADTLKKHLTRQEKLQWLLVRSSYGISGWTPIQNLLTPLHFSTKAQLLPGSPLYASMDATRPLDALKTMVEETVAILQIQNTRAQIKIGSRDLWTSTEFLYPIEKDPGVFYAKKDLALRASAVLKSQHVLRVPRGARLTPLSLGSTWVKVAYNQRRGYVPLSDVITRIDIASRLKTERGLESASRKHLGKKIYSIFINPLWLGSGPNRIPLFESPNAASPLIGSVDPWQNLTKQDSIEQEWAQSEVPQLGSVWWQIPQERTIFRKLVRLSLANIRDVKENPLFDHVKVASAGGSASGQTGGLFRSTDGLLWTPLKGFEKTSPAFTFSADGVLFVEDKISFDNGENFTPFVFWENLFKALQQNNVAVRNQVKIIGIESLNKTSQQLVLRLDTGGSRPVSVYTANRGRDWQYLNR